MNIQEMELIQEHPDWLKWPKIRIVAPRRYKVISDYTMEWSTEGYSRQRMIVPAGFQCDGASIPAALEWYLGRENILPAALIHDWQYTFAGKIPVESHLYRDPQDSLWKQADYIWSRRECDRFFARNLRFCCHIRGDQRRNAYRAVRLFGWLPWRRAEKKLAAKRDE